MPPQPKAHVVSGERRKYSKIFKRHTYSPKQSEHKYGNELRASDFPASPLKCVGRGAGRKLTRVITMPARCARRARTVARTSSRPAAAVPDALKPPAARSSSSSCSIATYVPVRPTPDLGVGPRVSKKKNISGGTPERNDKVPQRIEPDRHCNGPQLAAGWGWGWGPARHPPRMAVPPAALTAAAAQPPSPCRPRHATPRHTRNMSPKPGFRARVSRSSDTNVRGNATPKMRHGCTNINDRTNCLLLTVFYSRPGRGQVEVFFAIYICSAVTSATAANPTGRRSQASPCTLAPRPVHAIINWAESKTCLLQTTTLGRKYR